MTRALRWMVPVVAMTAVLMAAADPAVAAAGPTPLSNHVILGNETSISCMTMARCVAVGAGPRGAQVVSLYNGRQTRVTVLRYRAPLVSVSCPGTAGCWALGPLSGPHKGVVVGALLAKIGPTGKVVKTIRVRVPTGDKLSGIWCRSMTACQILGLNNTGQYQAAPELFFSPWNGERWRLDSFGLGGPGSNVTGLSCWHATCVLVGWMQFNSVNGAAYAWTFHNGVAGALNYGPQSGSLAGGHQTVFKAVSCVSASTCYAVGVSPGGAIAVTISDGVPSATFEPMPFAARVIACVRATCWATSAGNEVVTLRGGVVTGTPLTDIAVSKFAGIAAHGSGYIAIGAAAKRRGESEVVVG